MANRLKPARKATVSVKKKKSVGYDIGSQNRTGMTRAFKATAQKMGVPLPPAGSSGTQGRAKGRQVAP